jgi:hypothetical protein
MRLASLLTIPHVSLRLFALLSARVSVLDDTNERTIETDMLFTTENTRAVTAALGEYFQTHRRSPDAITL